MNRRYTHDYIELWNMDPDFKKKNESNIISKNEVSTKCRRTKKISPTYFQTSFLQQSDVFIKLYLSWFGSQSSIYCSYFFKTSFLHQSTFVLNCIYLGFVYRLPFIVHISFRHHFCINRTFLLKCFYLSLVHRLTFVVLISFRHVWTNGKFELNFIYLVSSSSSHLLLFISYLISFNYQSILSCVSKLSPSFDRLSI